jgi:hypothetical protein
MATAHAFHDRLRKGMHGLSVVHIARVDGHTR